MGIEVEDSGYQLHAGFVDDRHLLLLQGEHKQVDIQLHNSGRRAIGELWLVSEPGVEVWPEVVNTQGTGMTLLHLHRHQTDLANRRI